MFTDAKKTCLSIKIIKILKCLVKDLMFKYVATNVDGNVV